MKKKEFLCRLLRKALPMITLISLYAAAFGLKNALVLIQACISLVILVLIGIYPILFAKMASERGFLKALQDANPAKYIKMLLKAVIEVIEE